MTGPFDRTGRVAVVADANSRISLGIAVRAYGRRGRGSPSSGAVPRED